MLVAVLQNAISIHKGERVDPETFLLQELTSLTALECTVTSKAKNGFG